MYKAISLPNSREAPDRQFVEGWKDVFIGTEFVNTLVLLIAILLWLRRTSEIENTANMRQLKPSDYTLEVHNIPDKAKSDDIKEKLSKVFEGRVKQENIHVVKKFDKNISVFQDL